MLEISWQCSTSHFCLACRHAHTASAPQRAPQQDLFWNRSHVFVNKQIHETCFRTNPAGIPTEERRAVCMCEARQKCMVEHWQLISNILGPHPILEQQSDLL